MTRIRFGVYVGENGPKIGRGKIQLLEAVRDHGSISAAARSMGMAYRHAWLLLDELNQSFREPVIVSTMGGRRGGGARLTKWGEELVDRFHEMERLARASLAVHLAVLERRAVRSTPPDRRKPARGARTR